jgi:peptidoglycan-associated lipoprotein
MKLTKQTALLVVGLVATFAVSGCRKSPNNLTTIPGARTGIQDLQPANPSENATNLAENTLKPVEGFPVPEPGPRMNWAKDSLIFKPYTVHFDFDRSAVKAAEKPKPAAVADYLKANGQDAVEIEGHCDERGTEEYNRALGERRALALREELIRQGIDPARIDTISYGKDRPEDPGHTEAAWALNRRGVFVLEKHP